MGNLSIELKGLIHALVTVAVILGGIFGFSFVIVPHQAKSGQLPPASTQSAGTKSRASNPQSAQLVEGRQNYVNTCASCHGANAQGMIGPSLQYLGLPDAEIAAVIKTGIKGKMPAFGTTYDDHGVQALVAYVHSIQKPAIKNPPGQAVPGAGQPKADAAPEVDRF